MMTIGYIGNGKSTNRYHLPFVLQRKDTIRVKTIYCRNLSKQDWDRVEGVRYTDDLEELLNDADIQLICVCTPLQQHYRFAKMVLEHGKHCLLEKPFTNTVEQAEELFATAKEKGLLLQCYQNRRYDSDYLTVQKVIESGVLGDLLEVETNFDYYRPEVPLDYQRQELSGGFGSRAAFLYGHGCHTLDQVLSYFGEPEDVHYDVRRLLGKGGMNDYFDVDLYYGVLKVSVRSSYFRIKSRPSFAVYGKKGCFIKQTIDRQEEHLKLFYMPDHADFGLDLPEHYGTLAYYDEQGVYHEEKVPSVKGDYGRVYDGLYEALVNGREKEIRDEQTLCLMRLLEEGVRTLTGSSREARV